MVIPAYNEADSIEECLQSLVRQTRPADEIIVVDNNSTDTTAKIAARYARVVREPKQGIAPTRTRGFDEAKSDIIVRIDADTVAAETWLEVYEAAFSADSQLIAAGGRPLSRIALRRSILRWLGYVPALLAWIDRVWIKKIVVLYGFNFAVRRSAWLENRDAIAARDSVRNEDIEVSYILNRAGKVAYLSEAEAYFTVDDMSPIKFTKYLMADMKSMRHYRRRR